MLAAMKQLDIDDLPPKVAKALSSLVDGEELILVQNGVVVARLAAQETPTPPEHEIHDGIPPEEKMGEIMSQFNAMIHDEF